MIAFTCFLALTVCAFGDRALNYDESVRNLDFAAVREDLKELFLASQEQWPADYGHYGPFFIRLAWHCTGSYRTSDGRGGCEGGRQRFDPERSWDDNTNLDKARSLLWPIKAKYGAALSWGDLFVLSGTTAIEAMGGPVLGFCGGRVDDLDGSASLALGPTSEQEALAPCEVDGDCKAPLGATTLGLIYVNPEGPMGEPIPEGSAPQIRDTFGRMAMNDSETVALIGGGHAFGKTHGACPDGPGPSPAEDPSNPWPGNCGTGKGADAFTSGFEGPWTSNPIGWDNDYFKYLVQFDWTVGTGPGGHNQWGVENVSQSPIAPAAHGEGTQPVMMLTSDVSLLSDTEYFKIVNTFASDLPALENAFAHAWYKLTSRDMGPVERCVGDRVPPAQPWQYPLPPAPRKLADFKSVKNDISSAISKNNPVFPADEFKGKPYYGALFVQLAWQCASTFRSTDYLGGCNGARLRLSPQKDWPVNKELDEALAVLEPIKTKHGEGLTWADLIVLAGQVAIEEAGGEPMEFCGGRSDALEGDTGSEYLEPPVSGSVDDTIPVLKDWMASKGLNAREIAVLIGGGHSLGKMHMSRSGFGGSWTSTPTTLNNEYFVNLVTETWELYTNEKTNKVQYKARGEELYMLGTDMALIWDPELAIFVQEYALDGPAFLRDFSMAWTKLMNVDRFDGPTGNLCISGHEDDSSAAGFSVVLVVGITLITAAATTALAMFYLCPGFRFKKARVELSDPILG